MLRVAAVFYSMSAMEGARTLVDEAPEKWGTGKWARARDYRVTRSVQDFLRTTLLSVTLLVLLVGRFLNLYQANP